MAKFRGKAPCILRYIVKSENMDKTTLKYISAIAAAAIALTLYCPETEGQDYTAPAVTISKEKVKVNGRTCYTHIVLEKQTLYSISKAYNVSIDEIYEYNPGLKESGLKKNSIIVIPMSETAEASGTEKSAKDAASSAKTRQTKKGANDSRESDTDNTAKNGDISTNNKSTAAGNMDETDEPEDENAVIHTVRWYEDLESIAQKYGVSTDAIYAANNLKSKTLKSRQKLVIPQGAAAQRVSRTSETVSQTADGASDSRAKTSGTGTNGTGDSTAGNSWSMPYSSGSSTTGAANSSTGNPVANSQWNTGYSKSYLTRNEVNVALLLPLKSSSAKPNSGSLDFYCGALLAARDLGMEGVNINLNVKDISNGSNPFDKNFFNSSDIIIGPVSPSDISTVFTSSVKAGADVPYIISPLDPKASSLLASHSTLIQVPSPHSAQYRELTQWITEEYAADDKLIVISEKTNSPAANVKQLKKAIAESGLPAKEISYNILEGRKIIDSLREQMSKEGTSRIIIASESEAFVNDVLRNLNLLIHESYDIVLYGLSRFRSFDTIEVENFHNTNMRVCLPYYIDYESPAVMEFVKKFRALFKTEPTQFAFQGYDVAKYFMNVYSEYGDAWTEKMTEGRTDMLQASFDFSCSAGNDNGNGNGYENQAVRRVVYGPDYSIKVLKTHTH